MIFTSAWSFAPYPIQALDKTAFSFKILRQPLNLTVEQ